MTSTTDNVSYVLCTHYIFQNFHKTYDLCHAFAEAGTKVTLIAVHYHPQKVNVQELLCLFVKSEELKARRENRAPAEITPELFHVWAKTELKSPRSLWLYYMCVSSGSMLVVLRAAIRFANQRLFLRQYHEFIIFRLNNIIVAKGCVWGLTGMIWSNSLPLYQEALMRCGIAEEVQAPEELQEFLDEHRFIQRNLPGGVSQPVHHTHQPADIIHEEIIRLELMCLDKNRLKKNAETLEMQRDPEVFTQAARWLSFFGEKFVVNTDLRRDQRKYGKLFKQVLSIRSQLRKAGFLSDYGNSRLPFYSIDLKTELHPELHNFKLLGEENFLKAMEHLSMSHSYTTMPCKVQPKTVGEEERINKRNEQSKEELHKQAILEIKRVLSQKEDDAFLLESLNNLQKKKPQSFNPKAVLVELCSKVEQYIQNLIIEDALLDECDDEEKEVENEESSQLGDDQLQSEDETLPL